MDEPRHGRYRKPPASKFTARRMRLLTERVERIAAEHLDAMEKAGPPTGLAVSAEEVALRPETADIYG